MKITNKEVIQSYIMTTAKYDFSVFEKRILYRLIENIQRYTEGQKLNHGFKISRDLFECTDIIMPLSSILNGIDDKNHHQAKKAFENLENKKFTYEDDQTWKIIRIIQMPKIDKYKSFVEFKIQPEIYNAILDFSKGFRKYELKTAMGFESTYTMRFYELFSGQKKPITYSIESIKEMFQITDKYKKLNDFIKYVVDKAKKELDKSSPYSFDYRYQKTGRKVTALTFLPYDIPENKDERLEESKLEKQISPAWTLDKTVLYYLKEQYLFSTKEIQTHQKLFVYASEKIDLLEVLANSRRVTENKKNPKGYLIGIIKKKVNEINKLF